MRFRVTPSLENGDEKQIKLVKQIMGNLLGASKNLTMNDIVAFNEKIKELPNNEPLIKSPYAKMKEYADSHKSVKDILAIGGILLTCGSFAYVSLIYIEIPREIVFGSTIVLFGALITVYFRRKPT